MYRLLDIGLVPQSDNSAALTEKLASDEWASFFEKYGYPSHT